MRARQTAIILIATFTGCFWASASAAIADSTDYVLSTPRPTISVEGEDPTVDLTLINLTDQDATVTLATTEGGDNCDPRPEELTARQEKDLTFTLEGCDFGDESTVLFAVDVEGTPLSVKGKIAADETADPDWGLLWTYLSAFGAGIVLVLLGWLWFRLAPPTDLASENKVRLNTTLPFLGAKWSFKDSWAANVTLVSAVFTGLFGSSDLLKSAAGAEAPSTLALITIASGIGVAFVGLGPLLLQAARNDKAEIYAGGLFLSAAIAVGASGGLALIIARSVTPIVKGRAGDVLWIGVYLALFLLAIYAVTSVRQNLITGLTKPPPDVEDLNVEQRRAIVEVLSARLNLGGGTISQTQLRDEVLPELESMLPKSYPRGTGTGDYPAALI